MGRKRRREQAEDSTSEFDSSDDAGRTAWCWSPLQEYHERCRRQQCAERRTKRRCQRSPASEVGTTTSSTTSEADDLSVALTSSRAKNPRFTAGGGMNHHRLPPRLRRRVVRRASTDQEVAPWMTSQLLPQLSDHLATWVTPEVTPQIVPQDMPQVTPSVMPQVTPSVLPKRKDNKPWYTITWHDFIFTVLSVVILFMFLETHIETYFTGRPPFRFSCYLCGIIVCCSLWCLFMLQDGIDKDFERRD